MSPASVTSDADTPGEGAVVLPGAEAVAADLAVAEAVAAESAAPRSSCSGEARAGGVGPPFLVTADWDFETREAVCWRHGLRVAHVSLRQETVGLNRMSGVIALFPCGEERRVVGITWGGLQNGADRGAYRLLRAASVRKAKAWPFPPDD